MKRKPPLLDRPIKKKRELSEEEKKLWQVAMESEISVTAREHSDCNDPAPSQAQNNGINWIATQPAGVRHDDRKFSGRSEIRSSKIHLTEKTPSFKKNNFAIPLQREISKKMVAIEATFDLHGHTLKKAYPALSAFIGEAFRQKLRTLLVITGKGKKEGNSTIRALLPYWLQETGLREYVSSFSQAKNNHGGTGAWYITLKKSKKE